MEQRMAWGGEICTQGAASASKGVGGYRADSRLYIVTTCRQFKSCRLYSWILFTCTSNMDDGLIFTLYSFSRNWENFSLFSCGDSVRGQSSFDLGASGGLFLKSGAYTLNASAGGKDPHREASPASHWKFLEGRCHHPGSCVTLSAGSSLSRSLPQFSFSLKEEVTNQRWQSSPNDHFLSLCGKCSCSPTTG